MSKRDKAAVTKNRSTFDHHATLQPKVDDVPLDQVCRWSEFSAVVYGFVDSIASRSVFFPLRKGLMF